MARLLKAACAAAILLCAAPRTSSADVVSFSHTWTGTEAIQGPDRPFRDGVPSVAGVPKAFPGTLAANPTLFEILAFAAEPGTVVLVTPTTQNAASFLALYDTSFNPAAMATNYLGDQGSSLVTAVFSVTAPASGQLLLVASSVLPNSPIGSTIAADITFTPVGVPEPSPLALASLAGLGIGGIQVFRRSRRAKA